MDIPVSVTTHEIEVTVSETVVDVLVTATVQTIAVTVEYGVAVHNLLNGRDAESAHPASSITYGDGNVEEVLNGRFLSVDEGINVEIDNTDPQRPIISVKETPQFIDVDIPALKSDAAGGEIPATIYNWFKSVYAALVDSSVKSWIIGVVTYIKELSPQSGLTFTGAIDLTKVENHYSDYTQIGVLEITIAANAIVGGSAEVTITANGSELTITGATQYGDTAIDYTNGKINHFLFTKFEHGVYYSVKQLN